MNTVFQENRMASIAEESNAQAGHNRCNPTAKLDSRFIHNIKGKEFVLYAGLLDLAHQKGLQKLEVELIQIPTDANNQIAICRATVESKGGERFADIGDADPSNVTHMIVPHIIRMASTRAKARALRDFCNIGMCCVEELGEIEDGIGNEGYSGGFNPSQRNGNGNGNHSGNGNVKQPDQNNNPPTPHSNKNGTNRIAKMSEAQNRAILNLSKRRNISDDELNRIIQNEFQTSLHELTIQSASQLIQTLQKHS